jgi:probable F420-dependent oxidoreductase
MLAMSVGLSVYDMTAVEVRELSVAADDAGFDAIWLGEHIVLPVAYASEHPSTRTDDHEHISGPIVKPETELVDPWAALGVVAGATARLRLATGIYILPLRHPLITARSAATLQVASGGRLLLGIGAGWLVEEFAALGVPFAERYGRLVETIEIIRAAWAGGPFEYRGKYFSFETVQLTTDPVHVPLIMGGNTPKALQRAALLGDGWFSSGTPDFDDARRLRDSLFDLRARRGLDAPYRCYVRVPSGDPALVERYRAEGLDDVVVWADQLWPADGDVDTKRAALAERAAALL